MLRQRVMTAAVLIIVLVVIVFALPPPAVMITMTILIALGVWEWSQFLGKAPLALRLAFLVVLTLLMATAWFVSWSGGSLSTILEITLLWWVVALFWVMRYPTAMPGSIAALAGMLVLVPAWLALSRLLGHEHGLTWVLFLLLLVWAADIGAYFAGSMWGRVKLAPRVSPGKTWEGVIGGMLLAGLVAFLGAKYFSLDPVGFIALCMAVAAISIVGDLTVSMFKRHNGLKDSGQLFPGHGGVLDRIDSLCAAAPIFLLGLIWLGVFR